MDAYIYQADIYCKACGDMIRATLDKAGKRPANPENESSYDSDSYPKGPFGNGGGEADSPQHCGACMVHLENPLTSDGRAYVQEQIDLALLSRRESPVVEAWRAFYGDSL